MTRVQKDIRIIDAVKEQDSQAVLRLIEECVDLNVQDPQGNTALMWAVHRNNLDIVHILINVGADLDVPDYGQNTPLILAVWKGAEKVAQALISAEADLNMRDGEGKSALTYAMDRGLEDMIYQLVSKGADISGLSQQHKVQYHSVLRDARRYFLSKNFKIESLLYPNCVSQQMQKVMQNRKENRNAPPPFSRRYRRPR